MRLPQLSFVRSFCFGQATKPACLRGAVIALLILPLPQIGVPSLCLCRAEEQRVFTTKDFVDSVVQQEFFTLNAVMNNPDAEFQHKMAVEEARRVAQKLKAQAAGDPNHKYILFRVSELEQQLWLEEQDIVFKQTREIQKIKNAVIDTFNMELGKKRPDFSTLVQLTTRIDALKDTEKAEEMRQSQAQRKTNVSRELLYSFEGLFVSGDVSMARKEFEYLNRNRNNLGLTDATFQTISQKILLLADAIEKKPSLETLVRRGKESVQKNQFTDAWACINSARATLDQIQGHLSLSDRNSLESRTRFLYAEAIRKEDSLVKEMVSIYNAHGSDPALDYIEKTLKKMGVSENRVAAASAYVLSRGAVLPRRDSLINREVDALSNNQASGGIELDDIMTRAKQKAKAKADSIRTAEEAKAGALVLDIYSLLERGRIENANALFNKNLVALETYIQPGALNTLSFCVTQAYRTLQEEKNVPEQTAQTVAPSTTTIGDELKVNQEKAAKHTTFIYTLLDQGKVSEAFQHFKKFRDKLKQYVCKEAFEMMETSVTQAYASTEMQTLNNSNGENNRYFYAK
jgi:hypothetical protein